MYIKILQSGDAERHQNSKRFPVSSPVDAFKILRKPSQHWKQYYGIQSENKGMHYKETQIWKVRPATRNEGVIGSVCPFTLAQTCHNIHAHACKYYLHVWCVHLSQRLLNCCSNYKITCRKLLLLNFHELIFNKFAFINNNNWLMF